MNQTLLELLPWYANGTLSPADREFVEAHLDDDPTFRQQLAFYKAIQKELQESIPEIRPDLGLAETLKKINEDISIKASKKKSGTKLNEWLLGLFNLNVIPRGVFAFSLAIVAAQTIVIGYMASNQSDDFSQIRASQNAPPSVGPFIKISFRPDAKEVDIRFLMIQMGATIVGGPSQLGDYFLFLSPDRTDWAAQQLRKSPIVDSVTVMATLPAIKE